MIKLMMALVYLSGDVEHLEVKGSEYPTMKDCQNHVRQLSFTYFRLATISNPPVVGGGFYCEVKSAENP